MFQLEDEDQEGEELLGFLKGAMSVPKYALIMD